MHWTLAWPEIALALFALSGLMLGVTRSKGDGTVVCTMIAILSFAVVGVIVAFDGNGVAMSGTYVDDGFARFCKILVLSAAALTTLLSLDYTGRERVPRFEFPILLMFSTIGMMIMASAANLMTVYLGLELQSFPVYVLCAFSRDQVRSSEAGLKYFVLGALASGLLLYGISLTYGFGGSMQLGVLGRNLATGPMPPGLLVGLVFVLVGLAFKLSIAPFHMWTPDVYEGAPSAVTAFMSTAPKVAPFAALIRIMIVPFGHLLSDWRLLVEIIAIVSMCVGSLAAIGQTSIKRLLAYSSIGHMGYAAIGLAAGTPSGLRGVLVYLLTYIFMNAGTFGCVMAMRRRGVVVERIADLGGLGRTNPALAVTFAIFMFSMAGVPPFAGFFGKLAVFLAAIQSGLWTLVVVGIVTSAIGAAYYLRVVKVMWFDAAIEQLDRPAWPLTLVSATAAGFTSLFVLFAAPALTAAAAASRALGG